MQDGITINTREAAPSLETASTESVEDDQYLLTLVRYIHQNTGKAGIVNNLYEYKCSSYIEYTGGTE